MYYNITYVSLGKFYLNPLLGLKSRQSRWNKYLFLTVFKYSIDILWLAGYVFVSAVLVVCKNKRPSKLKSDKLKVISNNNCHVFKKNWNLDHSTAIICLYLTYLFYMECWASVYWLEMGREPLVTEFRFSMLIEFFNMLNVQRKCQFGRGHSRSWTNVLEMLNKD